MAQGFQLLYFVWGVLQDNIAFLVLELSQTAQYEITCSDPDFSFHFPSYMAQPCDFIKAFYNDSTVAQHFLNSTILKPRLYIFKNQIFFPRHTMLSFTIVFTTFSFIFRHLQINNILSKLNLFYFQIQKKINSIHFLYFILLDYKNNYLTTNQHHQQNKCRISYYIFLILYYFTRIYYSDIFKLMNIVQKTLLGGVGLAYALSGKEENPNCFIYRDDIGAFWGIHGYEEMVTQVGSHKGHINWPQYRFLGTFDSGSVRRGFQVFTRNCSNCHGMIGKKYDILLEKVYEQLELSAWVGENFTIHPAHHHFKQYYYQEWDTRDRYIHDHIYPTYFSQDQAKNANGGVWPTDFTKIRLRPGGINYIYNIMTGYYFKPPYGMDVPKGKHFNPYFDHMIIGMPRQLYDGLIEYQDGTPASTPQMANDVSNFICFTQRRSGRSYPDKQVRKYMALFGFLLMVPFCHLRTYAYYRSLACWRTQMYAVRDHLGYKHWKTGQKSMKAMNYKGFFWV